MIGVGNARSRIRGLVENICISSCSNEKFKYRLNALVIDELINLHTSDISRKNLEHIKTLPFPDPNFSKSCEIDGILGITIFNLILKGDKFVGK